MADGKKKDKINNIFVVDKGDELLNEATAIADYWKKNTGHVVSYSIQDVMRLLVKNYHKKLITNQPRSIDFNNLFIIN